jgi:hypothetical protein
MRHNGEQPADTFLVTVVSSLMVYCDNNIPFLMTLLDIAVSVYDLTQRIASIYDGFQTSSFNKTFKEQQIIKIFLIVHFNAHKSACGIFSA